MKKLLKKLRIGFSLMMGTGLVFLACQKGEETKAPGHARVAQAEFEDPLERASSALTPKKARESAMVVRVNDKEITVSDVDHATDILMAQYRDQIPPTQSAQAKAVLRKQATENLVNQRLLLEEADRKGIPFEQKAVDERIEELSGRFSSSEEFQGLLASMGLSREEFRNEIVQDLKIEAFLDGEMKDVKKVSAEEVSAFYRDHPESFRSAEQVRASHILISVDASAPAEDRTQKRLKLTGLRDEIEKGADFGRMASLHSDCPSKARGGDLGYFERGKMVKPFEDAAFQMGVGQVSGIVETQFGYHLIQVTDHQEPKEAPFDQVKGQIEEFLNSQTRDNAIGEYLGKLRGSAKIQYAEGYQP